MSDGAPPRGFRGLVQRGVDAASQAADAAAFTLRAIADPRGRLVRKRRYALWIGALFTIASVVMMGVTVLMAIWDTPPWMLPITAVPAALLAFPATLAFLRLRRLRTIPLPAPRPASSRRLPPHGSAARPAMYALGASERGLFSLLAVIERGELLPAGELAELTAAANHAAAAMAGTAAEVVSMERAAEASPASREFLAPTINAYTAQLGAGVRQYNEMVTAAAQLVAATNAGSTSGPVLTTSVIEAQRYRGALTDATDRMQGWADAFEQLGELRGA
ncbi:MAG: hypothetical protein U0R77_14920 [Mycolicibacterium insubricum]|nr:hypothetical protein [Mycobacterium sp.]